MSLCNCGWRVLCKGSFDFLYLPIDTSTKNNVGYAFVNFCDEEACMKCLFLRLKTAVTVALRDLGYWMNSAFFACLTVVRVQRCACGCGCC